LQYTTAQFVDKRLERSPTGKKKKEHYRTPYQPYQASRNNQERKEPIRDVIKKTRNEDISNQIEESTSI
jgi:hypothetical protein